MDQERTHFGSRLREQREAQNLSLGDLARVTKIPERSLERLEGGRFDELPAEVFVRGFVRSYSRAVGLDPEDMARRYGELVAGPGARAAEPQGLAGAVKAAAARVGRPPTTGTGAAAATGPAAAGTAGTAAATAATAAVAAPLAEAVTDESAVRAAQAQADADALRTMSRAILDAGRETRRLPLTLAVIILVIVATITMSLLLDRPSGGGSPVTEAPTQATATPRA